MTANRNDNDEEHGTELTVTEQAELVTIRAAFEHILERLDVIDERLGDLARCLDLDVEPDTGEIE